MRFKMRYKKAGETLSLDYIYPFFFLKVAIPERCLPSELGWPTGPQKPVFSLKEEQALVRKLTFSSDMAEGKRY